MSPRKPEREVPPALQMLRSEFESKLGEKARRPNRPTISTVVVSLAVAIVLLGALALTPPGRAIAGAIGDWLGVGGEPSTPGFANQRAIVIGTGDAASETAYEIFASTNRDGAREAPTCVYAGFPDLPEGPGEAGGICLNAATKRQLEDRAFTQFMAPAFEQPRPPDQQYIIRVLTRPEVARIEVSYINESGERVSVDIAGARLGDIKGEALGVEDRAGFFFGFIPLEAIQGESEHPRCLTEESVEDSLRQIEISAFDADGELVETQNPGPAIQFLFRPPEGYRSWLSTRLDGAPLVTEDEYCEATDGSEAQTGSGG